MRLYTYDQAAEILAVSEGWLRRRVGERSVPHTRLEPGRLVRFSDAHLAQIAARGEQQPAPPPRPADEPAPLATRRRRSRP